jgi:hypothetical protein
MSRFLGTSGVRSLKDSPDEMGQECGIMSKRTIEERLLSLESTVDGLPQGAELDALIEDKLTKMLPEIVERVKDSI